MCVEKLKKNPKQKTHTALKLLCNIHHLHFYLPKIQGWKKVVWGLQCAIARSCTPSLRCCSPRCAAARRPAARAELALPHRTPLPVRLRRVAETLGTVTAGAVTRSNHLPMNCRRRLKETTAAVEMIMAFFCWLFSQSQSVSPPPRSGQSFQERPTVRGIARLLAATSLEREWGKEREFNSVTSKWGS